MPGDAQPRLRSPGACTSGVARVASTFAWDSASLGEDRDDLLRRSCPGQYTVSGAPARRARCVSRRAKPRSSKGSRRSRPARPPARPSLPHGLEERRSRLGSISHPGHGRRPPGHRGRLGRRRARRRSRASLRLPDRKPRRSSVTWTKPSSPSRSAIASAPPVLPEARHLLARRSRGGRSPRGGARGTPGTRAPGRGLGAVDLPELLGGDGRAVREARGQAGHGRLVPGREVEGAREIADLGLPEPGVDQGRADAALPRRGHARAVVAEVVHGRAVGEVAQTLGLRRAARAARRAPPCRRSTGSEGSRRTPGCRAPGSRSTTWRRPMRAGQPPRLFELALGVALRVRGHQDGPLPQGLPRRPAEERRVHAAREGDRHALELPQPGEQAVVLGPRLRSDLRQGVGGAARLRAQPASSPGRRDSAPRCRRASGASSRFSEKSSTVNEAITLPYTIARRSAASSVAPSPASTPMNPPANVSPAPVGSNDGFERIGRARRRSGPA